MKRSFVLYLDESGDFDHDFDKSKLGYPPSLIGGVLFEKGNFTVQNIENIIDENQVHCTENPDIEKQMQRFKKLCESDIQFFVMNNKECIWVLDNNITYLNLMTQGIIKLLKYLKQKYNNISLEILIANRVDTTTGLPFERSVVQKDEYIKRLREKIIISCLEENIQDSDWKIEKASARLDKRLMIADVVCNTFFTRNKKLKKYSDFIESIYNNKEKTLIFTFLESMDEKEFSVYMMENRLGEAIAMLCQKDKHFILNNLPLLEEKIKNFTDAELELQYKFITAIIDYYLQVNVNYSKCITFLKKMIMYILPLFKTSDLSINIELDLNFYLITAYTHIGEIKEADVCINRCDELVKHLSKNWHNVDYLIRYDNRKIVHYNNLFDFESSLILCEDVIKKCTTIKELLNLCYDDSVVNYVELGKAQGNLVQIYNFLMRENPTYYSVAKCASECAVKEFVSKEDKERQFLYRSQLEMEVGNYDESLKYLFLACDVQDNYIADLVLKMRNSCYITATFIRLMDEGKLHGWLYTDQLFNALSSSSIIKDLKELSPNNLTHPYEIIFWKWASFLSKCNSYQKALENFNMAISICFNNNFLTLNVVGFAVELEKYSYVLKNNQQTDIKNTKKNLEKHYNKIWESDSSIMNKVFGTIDFSITDNNYFFNLSRKVTY